MRKKYDGATHKLLRNDHATGGHDKEKQARHCAKDTPPLAVTKGQQALSRSADRFLVQSVEPQIHFMAFSDTISLHRLTHSC